MDSRIGGVDIERDGQIIKYIKHMSKLKIVKGIIYGLITALGGVAVILGELDDSPGLGGIGLIMIGVSIYLNIRNSDTEVNS